MRVSTSVSRVRCASDSSAAAVTWATTSPRRATASSARSRTASSARSPRSSSDGLRQQRRGGGVRHRRHRAPCPAVRFGRLGGRGVVADSSGSAAARRRAGGRTGTAAPRPRRPHRRPRRAPAAPAARCARWRRPGRTPSTTAATRRSAAGRARGRRPCPKQPVDQRTLAAESSVGSARCLVERRLVGSAGVATAASSSASVVSPGSCRSPCHVVELR